MTPEEPSRTNKYSGTAENVLQVQVVHGDVHLGPSTDERVVISIVHHQKEVEFTGLTCVLSVTIENRGNERLHLSLKAVGLPGLRLGNPTVLLNPGVTAGTKVALERRADFPEANRCDLQVQAYDIDAGPAGRARWVSKIMTVVIPPEPKMRASVQSLTVAAGGEHQAIVKVHNKGNVRLTGSLHVRDPEWLRENWPGDTTNFLPPRAVRLVDRFEAGLEETTCVAAVVTVPEQRLLSSTFRVLFAVAADSPGVQEQLAELSVRQHGRLHEIPRYVERFFALRRQRRPFKIARVMDSLAAALAIGLVLGFLLSSAPREAGQPVAAAVVTTTSSPAPSTPDPVAAVDGAPVTMPCDAGTSIVNLEVVFGPEGAKYAKYLVAYQNEYIARVAPDVAGRFDVHYSTYEQICPAVKGNFHPEGAYYVWLGPMPSAGLDGICATLRRKAPEFCLVFSIN